MAPPNQPALNHDDDFSPGTSKDLHDSGTQPAGNFGMLQRKHRWGGVMPDEPVGGLTKAHPGGSSD